MPSFAIWRRQRIADPAHRLRAGLADLYRFYRQGAAMLTRTHRDKATLPESLQRAAEGIDRHYRDVLLEPFAGTRAQRRRLRAVLGHAVSFWTWRSLCLQGGLSDSEAVEAMATLALTAAAGPMPAPHVTQPRSRASDRAGKQDDQPAHDQARTRERRPEDVRGAKSSSRG